MEKVCIYIEKYYFEEKVFPYIESFLNDLLHDFILYIYIPDIFIIKNVIVNPNICDYLKSDFKIQRTEPNFFIDALIIFSDYDKGMYFDRRELIVKDLQYNKLFMINTNYFNHVIPIKNVKAIKLINVSNFMSYNEIVVENIFKTYNINCSDRKKYFFKKYNLKEDKKLLGLLNTNRSKIKMSLDVLSKKYNIISISINKMHVIKLDNIDFIYLISYSDEFITDEENFNFLSNVTSKKIRIIKDNGFENIEQNDTKNEIPTVKYSIKNILKIKNDIKNNFYIKLK